MSLLNHTSPQNQQNAANSLRQRLAQNNANNQNQQNNSPFRRTSQSGSRFGGNSPASNNNNRFGFNRFSRGNVEWTVQPMNWVAVRFSMEGLGDPFHRLLEQPLNVEFGDPQKAIAALQEDAALRDKLTQVLDTAWETYEFEGAAMLYPWDADVTRAFTTLTQPQPEPEQNNDDDDENNNTDQQQADTELEKPPYECLRAIDAALVLNILARTRSNIIVRNTPLALEPAFLNQIFICDDPRVVAIARATGCVGDNWI